MHLFLQGISYSVLSVPSKTFDSQLSSVFTLILLLDTATWAVSGQGMEDHFGAKSANWLAG